MDQGAPGRLKRAPHLRPNLKIYMKEVNSLAKPFIRHINPFDAALPREVTFSWSGSRACANRIIISDNETNAIVFDNTVSTYALRHTIPPNTLTNGKKYVIQAQIFDEENIPSALSDKVLFFTFATPEFCFEDITDDTVIANSSFTAAIHYYSADWENISKCVFYLYDAAKKQLLKSSEQTDDQDIRYTFKGLDNDTVYYIRCEGVTVNGMELDTGFIKILVKFSNPNNYARIYADPLPSQGCVRVASNLIIIQYNGTEAFDYQGGMIDLRDKTLYYDEGFIIEGDFTLLLRGTHLWQTADLLKMNNGKQGLTLSSRVYTDGTLRFRLLVPDGAANYLLYSEPLTFAQEDLLTIAIKRKNHVYQLEAYQGKGGDR